MSKINDLVQFGCVVVVMGGSFVECEVLFDFGCNVLVVFKVCGVDVYVIDGILVLFDVLCVGYFVCVFNILYGQYGGGEDGVLQGVLELFNVLYIGLGVFGLVLLMDKMCFKCVWQLLGLFMLKFVVLLCGVDVYVVVCEIGFLLIVKLVCEGFSVGVMCVFEEKDFDVVVELVMRYLGDLLMEMFIEGDELIVVIFGCEVLLSIYIVFKGVFYDYNVKYIVEDMCYFCLGFQDDVEVELCVLLLQVFDVLGCSGWGCVDVMCDCVGCNWLLEVNMVLGMILYLLVFKVVVVVGIGYEELCWCVLEISFDKDCGIFGGCL